MRKRLAENAGHEGGLTLWYQAGEGARKRGFARSTLAFAFAL